jgi:hypothetical protein
MYFKFKEMQYACVYLDKSILPSVPSGCKTRSYILGQGYSV